MVGDPELLDDVRVLEARDELTLRMVLPMHQEPATGDEEVERRLALAHEHGRLRRTGTAKFFLDGVLESGTAWLVDPGPGGANAHPFWPSVERWRGRVRGRVKMNGCAEILTACSGCPTAPRPRSCSRPTGG
jgi:hypothetical protein